jgi:EpsI family protein
LQFRSRFELHRWVESARHWGARILRPTPNALAIVLVTIAFWPTVRRLFHFWLGISNYSHGPLVALVCVLWLLSSSVMASSEATKPEPRAMLPLLALVLVWLVAFAARVDIVQQLLFPASLMTLLIAFCGLRSVAAVVAPIAGLYLVVPWWDYLVPLLQSTTIGVTEQSLRVLGIPVVVANNLITIPEGRFEIVDGCSGKGYLINGVTLAYFGSAYQGLSAVRRGWLVAGAVAVALFTNWLRVIVIVLAGHLTDMKHYLVAREHVTFGSVLMIAMFAVLLVLAHRFSTSPSIEVTHPRSESALSALAPSAARLGLGRLWVAAPLLLAPLVVTMFAWHSAPTTSIALGSLPVSPGNWAGPLSPRSDWRPRYRDAAAERRVQYAAGPVTVDVYVNVYGRQSDGRELIRYGNGLFASGIWSAAPSEVVHWDRSRPMLVAEASHEGETWLVAYSYSVGGKAVASNLAAQLRYGLLELTGRPAAGVVAIATRCNQGCDHAARTLLAFWSDFGSALFSTVPATY